MKGEKAINTSELLLEKEEKDGSKNSSFDDVQEVEDIEESSAMDSESPHLKKYRSYPYR